MKGGAYEGRESPGKAAPKRTHQFAAVPLGA